MCEWEARLALASVVEPGDPRVGPLLKEFGAEELWQMVRYGRVSTPWSARAKALDLKALIRQAEQGPASFLHPHEGSREWPWRVGALADCETVQGLGGEPIGLWVRGGRLDEVLRNPVAIVGSRAASPYGERVASDLAAELAQRRVCVVSGGAYGIDAAAHRGALAEGGPTVAVMAGALDEIYPKGNEALLERIAERGALVSEYPPGEHPTRSRFLARNRLIAALSVGTVVVEAAVRSGARNTATWATALNRVLMAVPGPVGSATSVTPHRLIREAEAVLVTNHEDVLELVGHPAAPARPVQGRLFDSLSGPEAAVYEALPARGGRDVGELALRTELSVGACLGALGRLAEAGLAVRRPEGTWRAGPTMNRPVVR